MKELSIIIPHFNSPSTLEKLLMTIPDKKNLEVLIIDDNSTKSIAKLHDVIKKQKKHKRNLTIKYYSNNSGIKGAGAARNIGISHAQGKWLLFADADDYFENGVYDVLSRYFNSTADFIIFSPLSRDYYTNKVSDRHIERIRLIEDYITNKTEDRLMKLKFGFPEPWSKLYKKEMINKNNIKFQETIVANDVLFAARVGVAATKTIVSKDSIYCVVKRDGSLTTELSDKRFLTRINVFVGAYQFLEKKLSSKDFEKLNLSATSYIFSMFVKKYSIETIIKVFKILKENKIRFFTTKAVIKYINPYKRFKSYKNSKKFLSKNNG